MNYTLVIVTHGDSAALTLALASFAEHVSPPPTSAILWRDGPDVDGVLDVWAEPFNCPWTLTGTWKQQGFCAACRSAWSRAAVSLSDYVFWLEHDFTFNRPVDLEPVEEVLRAESRLAQMQFMRGPVNAAEIVAGGLYESREGQYQNRHYYRSMGALAFPWMEHTAYFTTNPSLMRRSFMGENPWPDDALQCEGRFGLELVRRGYSFGVWGSGEPWTEHIGTRTGFGY